MMFYTYAIKSKTTGKIYIGQSDDLVQRLKRHNQKLPTKIKSYTFKNKGPWELIHEEKFSTRLEAVRREKCLKSHTGREWLKNNVLAP